ncbi:ABC transporter substrate-binding protein [Bradyrhizobium iriomotense]|uniref:ABC transporter substrate-binding protein n=1 Tax=Bradyrhizobium iriomotense TaxID=441950 RepID=A0ABQ6BDN2_9BRAD|nr:ABC transporter substrate-binding protein [Bradyrhizobium iriomotense]GLR90278.1 ABC transporter substrate-binding protein [Bradyrhizobium iriomotense]
MVQFRSKIALVVVFALFAASPALSATLRISHNLGYGGRESLDPISPTRFFEANQMIYDQLVRAGPDGQPNPALAIAWSSSPDLAEWTFKLRSGVRFSNGEPFTAQDAAYSLQRILSPKLASPVRSVLGIMDSIEARDDMTLSVKLKQADADFPIVLTDYRVRIVSSKAAGGDLDAVNDSGIGTGPFKVSKLDQRGTTVLAANPDYWDGKPGVAEVDIMAIADQDARNQALLAGQIDITEVTPGEIGLFSSNAKFIVQRVPAGLWNPIVMRTDTSPFNDVRVRKALRMLADRQSLLSLVVGEGNGAVACDAPVWPGDPYYNSSLSCPADPEGAKKLLGEAGYPRGLTVDLYTSAAQPIMVPLAEAYQAQAAKAGVKVNVRVVPVDGYWSTTWMTPNRPFVVGNWAQRPAAQVLNEVFRSGAKWNETAWNCPDFDALLDEARRSGTIDERKALYAKAQAILAEEGGAFIPFFRNEIRVYSSSLDHIDNVPSMMLRWHKITKK